MRLFDRRLPARFDLPAWIALAWIVVFGSLYAWMILKSRFPGLLHAIQP